MSIHCYGSTILKKNKKKHLAIDLDMLHHSRELHWLVLSLHGSRVQAITTIHELHNVSLRVAYGEVILRTQVLQRLHEGTCVM